MGVVSIRVPDDELKALRRAGQRPSEVAKRALHNEAERVLRADRWETIRKFRRPASRPVAELVRQAREDAA